MIARRRLVKASLLAALLLGFAGSMLVMAWQAPLVRDQIVLDE